MSDNFISRDGTTWKSRRERDGAVASGRFIDAALAYQHGTRRTRPRRWVYALRYAPLNFEYALDDIADAVEFQRRFGRGRGKLTVRV